MFESLYAESVRVAIDRCGVHRFGASVDEILSAVRDRFIADFPTDDVDAGMMWSRHRDNLRRVKCQWKKVTSSATCWSCLCRRSPEHRLTCGHYLCRSCVQTGESSPGDPYRYTIGSCPLCGHATGQAPVVLVPEWAGLRVLASDGGGCRGIIPLTSLAVLERSSRFAGIVENGFDLVVGTSSGKCLVSQVRETALTGGGAPF